MFSTVDIIIEKEREIVLIKRKIPPFEGKLAFPGGKVDEGETVEQAAVREGKEETSLDIELKEILGVYSDPERDPRDHVITTVFAASGSGELKASDDAKEANWYDIKNIDPSNLAFDHGKIFSDYLKWKKTGGTYWSSK